MHFFVAKNIFHNKFLTISMNEDSILPASGATLSRSGDIGNHTGSGVTEVSETKVVLPTPEQSESALVSSLCSR